MLSYGAFVSDVLHLADTCPKSWRKGQSVFNVVDVKYGVARKVQFSDNIDCFYDDNQIDPFLEAAYNRYQELFESQKD